MKAKWLGILVAVGFVALIGWRVSQTRHARAAPQEKVADVATVRLGSAIKADLDERVDFTGTVRPKNEVDIFAKVGGRIESLSAQVGDRVKSGTTLAVVEHREIGWQAKSAQAALDVARANLESAKLDYDRTVALHKGGSAAQAQLDQARTRLTLAQAQSAQAEAATGLANQQLANSRIDTPISGTVTRRPVNLGAQVGPASILFTVQDVGTLKLESSVDGANFSRLQKNAVAAVTVDSLPDQSFAGKVTLLSPSLDAQTRRAAVEVEIDNASGKLLPNMFARASVTVGHLTDVLTVPREAVLEQPGGSVVFRFKGDHVEVVKPKLGTSDGNKIAVLSGLNEGDQVAITGIASLADGAKVKVSEDKQQQTALTP